MAKRKQSKLAKGRKSALRVEALEQRQLLATITGAGTEVGSNITAPNGNVYDQVLMTGSQVTVSLTDAEIAQNQVVRVSLLDPTGDIVQVEFSGPGSMTISLADYSGPAAPTEYNQPGVQYVKGLATITISGSTANTNLGIYSVGEGNAFNPAALFDSTHDGGNGWADVAQVRILNDNQGNNGSTQFGGIRTGNVVYSANFGEVGISAPGVTVSGPVVIGDIDALLGASNAALRFGNDSTFGNVVVAGGDLKQTNGVAIQIQGLAGVNQVVMQSGASSDVDNGAARYGRATAVAPSTPDALTQLLDKNTQFFNLNTGALSVPAVFYNAADVTIAGTSDLSGLANKVLGNVTITGGLSDKQLIAAKIGSLTVQGDLKNSLVSTDTANANGANITVLNDADIRLYGSTSTVGSIGNVTVTGNFENSRIESLAGVGDVSIGGNASLTATAASGNPLAAFSTGPVHSPTAENFVAIQSYHGGIGNLSVAGTFTQTLAGGTFLAAQQGGIGNITVTGAATQSGAGGVVLTANDAFNGQLVLGVGNVAFNGGGTIAALATVNDQTGWAAQASKAMMGNVTSTGNLTVGGIMLTNVALGNVAVTGGNLTLNSASASVIGNVSGNNVAVAGPVTTTHGNLGTITGNTLKAQITGAVTSAGSIGAITGATDVEISGAVTAATSIGNIASNGSATADTGLTISSAVTAGTTVGNLSAAKAVNVAAAGNVTGGTGVGNVTAGTALTVAGTVQTTNGSIGNLSGATVTVSGTVDANETAAATAANVGTVSSTAGALSVTATGKIEAADSIGNLSAAGTGGAFSVAAGGAVTAINGAIGNITAATTLTVSGAVNAGTNVGNLESAGLLTVAAGGTVGAGVGVAVAQVGNVGTIASTGNNVVIDGTVTADGNVGLVSAVAGTLTVSGTGVVSGTNNTSKLAGFTSQGNMSIAGAVSSAANTNANGIGNFWVTGTTSTLTVSGAVSTSSAGSIGNFTSIDGQLSVSGSVTTKTAGNIGNFTTTNGVINVSGEISTGTTGNIGNFLVTNHESLANANLENIVFTSTSLIESGKDSAYGKDQTASAVSTLMQGQGSVGTVTGSNLLLQGQIKSANDIGLITASNNNLDILYLNGTIQARGSDSRIEGVRSIGSIDIENKLVGGTHSFVADFARNTFTVADDGNLDNDNGLGSIISSNGNITLRNTGDISVNLALNQDFNGAGGVSTDDVDFTKGSVGIIHATNGSITADTGNVITGGRIGNITAGQLLTLNGTLTATDGGVGTLISTGNAVQVNGDITAAGFARDISAGSGNALVSTVAGTFVGETAAQAAARGDIGFNIGTTAFNQPATVTGIRGALDLTIGAASDLLASDDIGLLTSTLGALTTTAGSTITASGAGSNFKGFLSSNNMTLNGTVSSAGTGLALGNADDANAFAKVIGTGALTVNNTITTTAEGDIGNFSTAANHISINAAISTTGVGGTGNIGTFTAGGATSNILVGDTAVGSVSTDDGVLSAGEVGNVGQFTAGLNIYVGDDFGGTVAGRGTLAGFTATAGEIIVGRAAAGTIGSAGLANVGNFSAGTDITVGGGAAGTVTGTTVGTFSARDIIVGNNAAGAVTATTGGIGNVTATRDILLGVAAAGSISSTTGNIGNFSANRHITIAGAANGTITATDGNIGNFTTNADNADADGVFVIGAGAGVGTISTTGATSGSIGTITSRGVNGGDQAVLVGGNGIISTAGAQAGGTANIGVISSTDRGGDIVVLADGNIVTTGTGSILGITSADDVLLTNGAADQAVAAGRAVGNITAANAITLTGAATTTVVGAGTTVGNLTATAGAITLAGNGDVVGGTGVGNISAATTLALGANSDVTATTGNIGTVTAPTITLGAAATLTATTGGIGNISASTAMTLAANAKVQAATTIGDLTVGTTETTANLTFAAGAGFQAGGANRAATNSIGNVTVKGAVTGADNSIEFLAGSIGNVSIVGDTAGALVTDVIFQANSGGATSTSNHQIGNIEVHNKNLAHGSALFASTTGAVDADSGVGFAAEGRIAFAGGTAGTVTLQSGVLAVDNKYTGSGSLVSGAATGVMIASGDSDFGLNAGGPDSGGTQVEMGKLKLVGDLVDAIATGTGIGVFITSGINPITAAGIYVDGNGATEDTAVVGVNSFIADVEIWDTNGSIVDLRTPVNVPAGATAVNENSLIGAAQFGSTIKIWNNAAVGDAAYATVTLAAQGGAGTNATSIDANDDNVINDDEIVVIRL